MVISKLEKTEVLPSSEKAQKSYSGKVTGTILGAALSSLHFSELNRNGNIVTGLKNYSKSSRIAHPMRVFALTSLIIITPFVAIGATLDSVINTVREENMERIRQKKLKKQEKQIDLVA